MKSNHKIQAYTLSEMIVVLILTTIVVGLAFSVLTLVQKHMVGIKENFNNNTELNKLEQSLWVDFNRYSIIEYNALNDELNFKTELDSVSYKFNSEFITKNRDTFNVKLDNKGFYFDGSMLEKGLIDAIKMRTGKALQNQYLFIYHQTDANSFMQ